MGIELVNVIETAQSYFPVEKILPIFIENDIVTPHSKSHIFFGTLENNFPVMLKVPSYKKIASHEWKAYIILSIARIAIPLPIAFISLRDDEKKKGIVIEKINAKTLSIDPSEEGLTLMGRELYKLHQVKIPGWGKQNGNQQSYSTPQAYNEGRIQLIGKKIKRLMKKDSRLINRFLENSEAYLESNYSSFLHHDLNNENVLLEQGGVKIIDFEWWQSGSWTEDIAIYLFNCLKTTDDQAHFVQMMRGYVSQRGLLDYMEKTAILFYLLLYCLEYISFIEEVNPSATSSVAALLNRVIKYIKEDEIERL